MKLYYSRNLNPRVAVAVAKHLKSPVEFIAASPMAPANRESFKVINPNTRVPVLVENGISLWETDAIACRLSTIANSDFWPVGTAQPELIRWLSWNAYHLSAQGSVYYWEHVIKPRYFGAGPDVRALDRAEDEFHQCAGVLDETLNSRQWLVDERLSYADFRTATIFPFAEEAKMPVAGFKHIKRWCDQLNAIEAWRDPFAGLS